MGRSGGEVGESGPIIAGVSQESLEKHQIVAALRRGRGEGKFHVTLWSGCVPLKGSSTEEGSCKGYMFLWTDSITGPEPHKLPAHRDLEVLHQVGPGREDQGSLHVNLPSNPIGFTFWWDTWPFCRFPLYCCSINSDIIISFLDQRNHLVTGLFSSRLPISSSLSLMLSEWYS